MDFGIVHSIPPVTQVILLLVAGSIAVVSFDLVHPVQMVFSPTLVFQEKQYWRLLTTFTFFGNLNLNSLFELHWLYTVSSNIESQYFQRRRVDYCFTLLTGMLLLLALRTLRVIETPYLSFSLFTALMYLFSRLLPYQEVRILGLISLQVRLLPLVFLGIGFAYGGEGSIKPELIGNLVGHVLWYLLEIFPRITKFHPLRVQQYFLQ